MKRSEILQLCSYAEEMYQDAIKDPEQAERLLNLAEKHLTTLLNDYKVECVDETQGFVCSRRGWVKLAQKKHDEAKVCFNNALTNLTTRGEYCNDRAYSYWGLARTHHELGMEEEAKEFYEAAVHVYASLADHATLKKIQPDVEKLGLKIEDLLPVKNIGEDGKPIKCRECGKNEFKIVEETEEKTTYECTACGCRNVVLKK